MTQLTLGLLLMAPLALAVVGLLVYHMYRGWPGSAWYFGVGVAALAALIAFFIGFTQVIDATRPPDAPQQPASAGKDAGDG
jgi:surface polysaccharide O-acyltransferase-like enzyme